MYKQTFQAADCNSLYIIWKSLFLVNFLIISNILIDVSQIWCLSISFFQSHFHLFFNPAQKYVVTFNIADLGKGDLGETKAIFIVNANILPVQHQMLSSLGSLAMPWLFFNNNNSCYMYLYISFEFVCLFVLWSLYAYLSIYPIFMVLQKCLKCIHFTFF